MAACKLVFSYFKCSREILTLETRLDVLGKILYFCSVAAACSFMFTNIILSSAVSQKLFY